MCDQLQSSYTHPPFYEMTDSFPLVKITYPFAPSEPTIHFDLEAAYALLPHALTTSESFKIYVVNKISKAVVTYDINALGMHYACEFVNAANAALGPIIFSINDKINALMMHNVGGDDGQLFVFNELGVCIAFIDPGFSVQIDLVAFVSTWEGKATPDYFLVPNDLHICSVWAEPFRKKEAGSYERFEDVWLPAGLYGNLHDMTIALTANANMKGERNGAIYKFEVSAKRPVLRLIAHHRQPGASWLRLTPADGSKAAGLTEEGKMVLGNRKFIDFKFSPKTLMIV